MDVALEDGVDEQSSEASSDEDQVVAMTDKPKPSAAADKPSSSSGPFVFPTSHSSDDGDVDPHRDELRPATELGCPAV